jgi:hypothetical protein
LYYEFVRYFTSSFLSHHTLIVNTCYLFAYYNKPTHAHHALALYKLNQTKPNQTKPNTTNKKKVFQNNPRVYNILTSLKFKPSYLRFKWDDLPIKMKINAQLLGYDSRLWDLGKKVPLLKSTLWQDLQWKYKLSAFQLGYDIQRWNRFV